MGAWISNKCQRLTPNDNCPLMIHRRSHLKTILSSVMAHCQSRSLSLSSSDQHHYTIIPMELIHLIIDYIIKQQHIIALGDGLRTNKHSLFIGWMSSGDLPPRRSSLQVPTTMRQISDDGTIGWRKIWGNYPMDVPMHVAQIDGYVYICGGMIRHVKGSGGGQGGRRTMVRIMSCSVDDMIHSSMSSLPSIDTIPSLLRWRIHIDDIDPDVAGGLLSLSSLTTTCVWRSKWFFCTDGACTYYSTIDHKLYRMASCPKPLDGRLHSSVYNNRLFVYNNEYGANVHIYDDHNDIWRAMTSMNNRMRCLTRLISTPPIIPPFNQCRGSPPNHGTTNNNGVRSSPPSSPLPLSPSSALFSFSFNTNINGSSSETDSSQMGQLILGRKSRKVDASSSTSYYQTFERYWNGRLDTLLSWPEPPQWCVSHPYPYYLIHHRWLLWPASDELEQDQQKRTAIIDIEHIHDPMAWKWYEKIPRGGRFIVISGENL
jgi:hypothetical protein